MEDQSIQTLKTKEGKNKSSNQNESNNNQEINAEKTITDSKIVFLEKNNQEPLTIKYKSKIQKVIESN